MCPNALRHTTYDMRHTAHSTAHETQHTTHNTQHTTRLSGNRAAFGHDHMGLLQNPQLLPTGRGEGQERGGLIPKVSRLPWFENPASNGHLQRLFLENDACRGGRCPPPTVSPLCPPKPLLHYLCSPTPLLCFPTPLLYYLCSSTPLLYHPCPPPTVALSSLLPRTVAAFSSRTVPLRQALAGFHMKR